MSKNTNSAASSTAEQTPAGEAPAPAGAIIHHAMLVRRILCLNLEHGASLTLGKEAFRQLVCEPKLFDVITFETDHININTATVIIDPDGGQSVQLQQFTPRGIETWEGTLQ